MTNNKSQISTKYQISSSKRLNFGAWNLFVVWRLRFGIFFMSLIFLAASCNHKVVSPSVSIAGHRLDVEIADTQEKQLQGLSGRDSLAENSAMLFVLKEKHRYTFWMKDMKFPLDFIWIVDGEVVQINPNAPIELGVKDSLLKIYTPYKPVDSVLEANAGWAQKNGIKAGDRVDFNRVKR